jgi:hypothetical protein
MGALKLPFVRHQFSSNGKCVGVHNVERGSRRAYHWLCSDVAVAEEPLNMSSSNVP